MPASTYFDLFDLERPIEQAWKTVLARNGLPIGFTQREISDQAVPRIDIQAAIGATTGHRKPMLTGESWLDAWACRITLQIVTQRKADAGLETEEDAIARPDLPEDLHHRIRAKIRYLAQYAAGKFNDRALLPYHVLTKIEEGGTAPSVISEDDCDVSAVSFDCLVSIHKDAWPVDAEVLGTPGGEALDLGGGVILEL